MPRWPMSLSAMVLASLHRKQASVYDVAELLPHAAGLLVQREMDVLHRLTSEISRPYVVILGGRKSATR